MADKLKNKPRQDNRSKYESPRATRLRDMQTGAGGIANCFPAGSGDTGGCSVGIGASGGGCLVTGNAALGICSPSGSNVIQD